MIKKIKKFILVGFISMFGAVSCVDWLDKTPDAIIDETVAFANFTNFQGFIEGVYNMIPNISRHCWVASFNWGDDEIWSPVQGDSRGSTQIDRGNFRWYINNSNSFLMRNNIAGWRGTNRHHKDIWGSSWYTIRIVNTGLQAIADGLLVDATAQERDVLLGQLYFFRGWAHFNLIKFWGGMPFIDEVLPTDERLTKTRLSYQETAARIGEDFRRAADLLPIDWDREPVGVRTLGQNQLRANRIWALGMLGKNYLFAASPLMEHGAGSPLRTYNREFARRAGEAFGELLDLVHRGETQYALVPFEQYSQLFFTWRQGWMQPGLTEAIIRGPAFGGDGRWRQNQSYLPASMTDGDNIVIAATANYVNMFGMANGLPLTHPASGFNPDMPWYGRDPRFYTTILFDGVRVVSSGALTGEAENLWRFANLYTGGSYVEARGGMWGIRTGYGIRRFIPLSSNNWDLGGNFGDAHHMNLSWLRLADVYLMYAEAVAQATQSPTGRSSNFTLTAVDAVNVIRERAGVAPLHSDFTGSLDAFMSELRRERAVELAFEAHRFHDLRRWLLFSQYPYNIKTRQDFDRVLPFDPDADPRTREVRNFRETLILQRNFDSRHYWLPINDRDVNLYEGFTQNPGW